MSEQKRSRNFNRLAWFFAPVAFAALLLAGGVSVIIAHAAPSLSGDYNFQANVNVGGLGSQAAMTVSGQLDLQVSGQNVQGKLCNVMVTLSSGLVNSGLLNNVPLSGLLSNGLLSSVPLKGLLGNGLLNTGPITLSGGSNVCLNVTGTVSGTDAITMTVVNLLPGQNLLLSGLPNPGLGSQGGLNGSLQLNSGLIQAGGSWSALLTASN